MEYLLIASAASFIAACVAVLVLEPRVQSREPSSAGTGRRPGAGLTAHPTFRENLDGDDD
jgi:hypothetical protein